MTASRMATAYVRGVQDGARKALHGVERSTVVASMVDPSATVSAQDSRAAIVAKKLPGFSGLVPMRLIVAMETLHGYSTEPKVRPSSRVSLPPKPRVRGGHEHGRVDVSEGTLSLRTDSDDLLRAWSLIRIVADATEALESRLCGRDERKAHKRDIYRAVCEWRTLPQTVMVHFDAMRRSDTPKPVNVPAWEPAVEAAERAAQGKEPLQPWVVVERKLMR